MGSQVRVTLQTLQVLQVLLDDTAGPHYGLAVSRTFGLPTGSVYPIMTRLEIAGWISSAWEDIDESAQGRRRRRYYWLTEQGATCARHEVERARHLLSPAPSRARLSRRSNGMSRALFPPALLLASLLVKTAVRFLPAAWRARFREEWQAELDELRRQRLTVVPAALGVLRAAPAMGGALRREDRRHPIRRTVAAAAFSVDIGIPNMARMYDYYLGGGNYFAADREAADEAMASWASVRVAVRENRAFLGRAVRYLAGEAGIRQFLDIGTGLPSAGNVHEVAQAVAPESRIAYVDNDPIVLAHARSLLKGTPRHQVTYIDGDLRNPAEILASPEIRATLDFSQPIALVLVAVLHFLTDEDQPASVIRTLLDALAPGSYIVASHVSPEHDPVSVGGLERSYRRSGIPARVRPASEFTRLAFSGLRFVPPGVVLVSEWRPETADPLPPADAVNWYGGVALKQ